MIAGASDSRFAPAPFRPPPVRVYAIRLVRIKGTVSRESLKKYKSAKTHLQQWKATGSGAFS